MNEIWEEIINIAKGREEEEKQQEGEITLYEFMDKTGMTIDKARKYLSRLAKDGKITKRKTPGNQVFYGITK